MGCFLPCFGGSKHRKSKNKQNAVSSAPSGDDQRDGDGETPQPTKQEVEMKIEPIIDPKEKHEEQVDGNIKKKVTFDLNVKTYEEFPAQQIKNCLEQFEKEKEKEKEKGETQIESQTQSDSSMSSLFSYPPSHRYHKCTSSDDETESIMELVENDSDGNENSESLFSLSIESRKQVSPPEMEEKEVNSPITIGLNQSARERGRYVNSVLNPVENLTQWKAAKSRKSTPLKGDPEKENIDLEQEISIIPYSEEPSFKSPNHGSKHRSTRHKPEFDGVAVDTSLSSWLVESDSTPISKNSPKSVGNSPGRVNSSRSYEDRPILGALTVEELKQLSASSSPRRKSPSRSPDEMIIIGTVGSYWNHTGRAVDSDSGSSCKGMRGTRSKYRKDERMKVHSAPFETRLERATDQV